ncbi:YbaN family protein [bacterium]|nr:YbaN family protein [bacterium]
MMLKKTVTKIYFSLGLIFLILAIVGIILPLLPTTPFALLAIFFFDHSSPKFHKWCLKIPIIGEGIDDWKKHKVIRKRAKVQAVILLIISGVIIVLKDSLHFNLKIAILAILVLVLSFIVTRSSNPDPKF